jgi:phage gp46-like protein
LGGIILANCDIPVAGRRKLFWSTQPDCFPETSCDKECAGAGLRVEGGKIDTSNWVVGLAMNIILTDAKKPDTECGWYPGTRGGHWSDSFRNDGRGSGSSIRFLKTSCSVGEMAAEVQNALQHDLSKLVVYGVARSIKVTAKYAGKNTVDANVEILGENGQSVRVGVSAQRIKNSWVWGATA